MNDRFKFRVWDTFKNKYSVEDWLPMIDEQGDLCFRHTDDVYYPFTDQFIIEQCTGLKDKNGNLIYEGDLIKSPNNSHKLAIIRMESGVYGCKECRFHGVWEMNLYDLIKHYGVEIIGNVHKRSEE